MRYLASIASPFILGLVLSGCSTTAMPDFTPTPNTGETRRAEFLDVLEKQLLEVKLALTENLEEADAILTTILDAQLELVFHQNAIASAPSQGTRLGDCSGSNRLTLETLGTSIGASAFMVGRLDTACLQADISRRNIGSLKENLYTLRDRSDALRTKRDELRNRRIELQTEIEPLRATTRTP